MATIAGAAIVMSTGAFFNIILNAAKAIIIANYFGTGPDLDAFFIAIIPPTIVSGILLGAMQSSIIPVFIEYATKGREEDSHVVFRSFFTLSLIIFFIISLLLAFFSKELTSMLAPGFKDERLLVASTLLKIMAPTILIGGAADLVGGLFNAKKKFAIPAIGGVMNVVASLGYLLLFRSQGIVALAFATLIGSLAYCFYMAVNAVNSQTKMGISFDFRSPGVKQVFHVMVPMLLGTTFSSLNIAVDQIMASTLSQGSVSALNYANSMNSIFTQLFIFSISSAILPFFSQQIYDGKIEELKNTFSLAARMAFFILIPITLYVFILGTPIVKIIFERGAFDYSSTIAVSRAWKAFALGLTVMGVGIMASRVLISLQLTKILAFAALINVFINVVLNALFMRYLGHVGIALSTSISYLFTSGLVIYFIKRAIGRLNMKSVLAPFVKIMIFSFISAAVVYAISINRPNTSVLDVILPGVAGIILYLALSWVGKSDEAGILLRRIGL